MASTHGGPGASLSHLLYFPRKMDLNSKLASLFHPPSLCSWERKFIKVLLKDLTLD